MTTINDYIRDIFNIRTRYYIYESLILCGILFTDLFAIASLLDYFIILNIFAKLLFWALMICVAAILAVRIAVIGKISMKQVIFQIQNDYNLSDNLLNAWLLSNNAGKIKQYGMSEELSALFIDTALAKLPPPETYFDTAKIKRLLKILAISSGLFLFLIFYPPNIIREEFLKIVNPFGSELLLKELEIYPGSVKLPYGTDIKISVAFKSTDTKGIAGVPKLYIKKNSFNKLELPLVFEENKYVSSLSVHLIEPVEYYIAWRGMQSGRFLLEPIEIPKLGDFKLTYFFPVYTGLSPQKGTIFGDRPYLPGTRIEYTAQSNKEIDSVTLIATANNTSKILPVQTTDNRKVTGELVVDRNMECYFEIKSKDAIIDPNPTKYSIVIGKDLPPEIEIVSPAEDIVAGQDSEVNIVYKFMDDYGISGINLVYEKKDKENRIAVTNSRKIDKNEINEYTFKLAKLNLSPGETVKYYMEVFDNDTITGPKKNVSKTYSIQIFSYELEHDKIEGELKEFRDDLMQLLGQQNTAKNKVDELMKNNAPLTDANKPELIKSQNNVNDLAEKLNNKLDKILDKMETDPFVNYQIYTEYKSINSGIKSMKENQMKNAVDSLNNKDLNNAGRMQDEIINNLEKMNLLAEDVMQYQKMDDILGSNEKINELAQNLVDSLSENQDKPKLDELQKTLDEIDKLMQQVSDLIQKMPKELPEEFVNKPAVKEIDFNKMNDISQSLKNNLAKGNIQDALKQAQELLKQTQKMLKSMQESSQDVGFGSLDKSVSKELSDSLMEMDSLINEQNKIIQDTMELEKKRQEMVFKEQEKMFDSLAARQKYLIELSKKIINEQMNKLFSKDGNSGLLNNYVLNINQSLPEMEKVYSELSAKRVVKSQEYLKNIITRVSALEIQVINYTAQLSTPTQIYGLYADLTDKTAELKKGEQEILDTLSNPPKPGFNGSDKDKLNDTKNQQEIVKSRTNKLDKSIQDLSRKTATIGPEVSSNLRQASREMDSAIQKLSNSETNIALDNEQKALDMLTASKNATQNAQGQVSEIQGKSGQPMSGSVQGYKPGGQQDQPGGKSGLRKGYVKLPKKDDYIPTKELREELLKSLKEKYPSNYEEIIKEYYKSLTK